MCRLFGLTAGTVRVKATFWLLDAPDSLQVQSHRNADGAGLGFFGPAGEPVLDKQPEPAFSDPQFIREACARPSPRVNERGVLLALLSRTPLSLVSRRSARDRYGQNVPF